MALTALSVNVNKIAWLRNARYAPGAPGRPDVCDFAAKLIAAGVDGITVHPRPDQRHIRAGDVPALARVVRAADGIEYNVEGNPDAGPGDAGYPGFRALVDDARPDQCTLVPDADDQLTSDHGWDLSAPATFDRVRAHIADLKSLGARVSLFMDPARDQISRARDAGADRIELYTGPYADLVTERGLDDPETAASLERYHDAARHAAAVGLGVNAGHDLDLVNLRAFVAVGNIAEVSIGHALTADALDLGLPETVRRYLQELGR